MSTGHLNNIITTLIINGFHLNEVKRINTQHSYLDIQRFDTLGAKIKYLILSSTKQPSKAVLSTIIKKAKFDNSTPLGVGEIKNSKIECYSLDSFFSKLGGQVNTGLILIPKLPNILDSLGKNTLPDGIDGKPDDLLETYVKESLQYLLNSPARKYGKDRLFESLPDGVVLGKDKCILLFDAKAYSAGFEVQSDDLIRFEKYVNEFNFKYGTIIGKVFSFIVVSAMFNVKKESLEKRSNDFYGKCQTKLSFIKSKELGNIVKLIRKNNVYRNSINWKQVFSNTIVTPLFIESQIKALKKDKIVN
ncbi:MAG: hypothetical protein ACUZ8N_12840 [Candidatus Scalindua sp.]